jgi:hypothetical protein
MNNTIFTKEAMLVSSNLSDFICTYIVERLEKGKSHKSILKKLNKKINCAYKLRYKDKSWKYLPKDFFEIVNKYIYGDNSFSQEDILLLLKLEFFLLQTRVGVDVNSIGSPKQFIEDYKEEMNFKNKVSV